jgi:hypothetical protein
MRIDDLLLPQAHKGGANIGVIVRTLQSWAQNLVAKLRIVVHKTETTGIFANGTVTRIPQAWSNVQTYPVPAWVSIVGQRSWDSPVEQIPYDRFIPLYGYIQAQNPNSVDLTVDYRLTVKWKGSGNNLRDAYLQNVVLPANTTKIIDIPPNVWVVLLRGISWYLAEPTALGISSWVKYRPQLLDISHAFYVTLLLFQYPFVR